MGGVRVAALAAAGVWGLVTFTAARLPRTHLTSRQPPQHAPLEAVASITARLAGSQIFGRLLWQGRFNELILAPANDLMMWTLRAGPFPGDEGLGRSPGDAAQAQHESRQVTGIPCVRMET